MYGLSDTTAITMQPLKKTYEIAGKKLSFETGKLGLLANGAITMSDENGNMLFTTAGIKEAGLNEKADFFPLVVIIKKNTTLLGRLVETDLWKEKLGQVRQQHLLQEW